MGKHVKSRQGIQSVKRLFLWQLGITVLASALSVLLISLVAGWSALLGGLVSIAPNAVFAWKLFQYQGAKSARQIVNGFYKGEAFKISLSAVMFALVFIFFTVKPAVFFAVFIIVQMVFWFAPLIVDNKLE